MSEPWVRIVLVDYKSGDYLARTVAALAAQTYAAFEVVIVDNACPEGAARRLQIPDSRFRILTSPENLGFAGGSNLGAAGAKTQGIATLNPDATPDRDWLNEINEAAVRFPFASMLSTTLLSAEDSSIIDGFGDVLSFLGVPWRGGHGQPTSLLPAGNVEVFAPCGAAAFYRRDSFEALGGFDGRFFCYLEDVDLAWRDRLSGGRCIQVRKAVCRHAGSISTQKDPGFPVAHSTRNGVWMIIKNAPAVLLAPMLCGHLAVQTYLMWRYRDSAYRKTKRKALKQALTRWKEFWRSRSDVRRSNAFAASRWLDCNIFHLRKRSIVSRPIVETNARQLYSGSIRSQ